MLDIARLAKEIGQLSAQNDDLLKSVDMLLHLHESEKAQRQSLQATLDLLTEEVGIAAPARSLEAVATEIRNGVSEDLKPLLHAIVALLELSVQRASTTPAIAPAPSKITDAAESRDCLSKRDSTTDAVPPEDLPGALPEILTKSVEELVGKRRTDRPKASKPKKSDANGNQQRTATKGHHSHAWIPVTSDTFKS